MPQPPSRRPRSGPQTPLPATHLRRATAGAVLGTPQDIRSYPVAAQASDRKATCLRRRLPHLLNTLQSSAPGSYHPPAREPTSSGADRGGQDSAPATCQAQYSARHRGARSGPRRSRPVLRRLRPTGRGKLAQSREISTCIDPPTRIVALSRLCDPMLLPSRNRVGVHAESSSYEGTCVHAPYHVWYAGDSVPS